VVEVPAAPAPPQSAVQPQPAPAAALFVRLPDGRQVGPLTQAALTQAVQQGQVSANCHIWQQGWPQPRWAGELFPALAQQAPTPPQGHAPPMGNAAAIVYPPGAGQTPGPPQGYGFDPLTGGYGGVGQHAAPQLLGVPQMAWGSMQTSSQPSRKSRRDGPFGRATDGRGFAIAVSACLLLILQEVAMLGLSIYASHTQDRDFEVSAVGLPFIRWILIGSATVGILKRKKEARWLAVGLLLLLGLACGPLSTLVLFMVKAFGLAIFLGTLVVLDVAMAALLSFSPSASIYFSEED